MRGTETIEEVEEGNAAVDARGYIAVIRKSTQRDG